MAHIANKIDAKDKKLAEVLSGQRYKIDVFQREYRWQRTQIEALISDLSLGFLKSYKDGDSIENSNSYDCYYMGPIVVCQDEKGDLSIVDGQQRLTSFTLLLIYLNHLQKELNIDDNLSFDINSYLYVKKGGKKTLVLNNDSRNSTMEQLLVEPNNVFIDESITESLESNQTLVSRYEDISILLPFEIKKAEVLPIFVEWLLHNVVLVEVKAYSIENAYSIFETMNDRGLTLNPTEILKGYLLSKIVENHSENEDKAEEVNAFWTGRIQEIKSKTAVDSADLDFLRSWLRAKYAESQRMKKVGSENEDFESIGTQFHTWVKNNTKRMNLKDTDDYYYFIRSDFDFYSSLYLRLNNCKKQEIEEFRDIYINEYYTIADSLSYPLYLAPISKIDDDAAITSKIQIVARFIDRYVNIRTLRSKTISQSSIRNSIYEIVKQIRNVDTSRLQEILSEELQKQLSGIDVHYSILPMNNSGYYHYFYARVLDYLNTVDDFKSLLRSKKQNSYVLTRIFSLEDFGNEFDEPTLYAYFNSVSNFFIIRRYDVEQYPFEGTVADKLTFLQNKDYLLGMDINGISSALNFVSQKDNFIQNITKKIWNSELGF
ncbi:MAG: DUF262 domain-containing protein [Bacteroidales bacterium]|nr:DUF262 domain-containing protein [Candidatus Scybalousia scybalohippi]